MVFAVASVALMTVDHRQHHLDTVRDTLSAVVYPLQYAVNLPFSAGEWLADTLASRSALLEENATLRTEHRLLEAQLQKLAALEAENQRLRELLDSSSSLGERILAAELLSVDLDPYRHRVLINKGGKDNVEVGQPVIDAHGIMGQLVHVGPVSSVAMLISDPSHAVPVQVNRNGLRTIAVGSGSVERLELPHLPTNADIREGDLLVTSGLGGRFPSGYPVARVTRVERRTDQEFSHVIAQPTAHLDRSRHVLLVWSERTTAEPEPSKGAASLAEGEE